MLRRFAKDRKAATAMEYGMIIGVLSLAIIGALGRSANQISDNFNFIGTLITDSATKE